MGDIKNVNLISFLLMVLLMLLMLLLLERQAVFIVLCYSASDVVHVPDGIFVLLEDVVALELKRGTQFAAGHAEVGWQYDPLLHALGVGCGLAVSTVHALLDCSR